jgi:hypothetical protein
LWNFFNDYQDQWPLERTNLDSSTETVIATLVTPNPSPVSIFPDTVTSLPLTFHVPEVGPITFDTGSLDVSLEVDAVAASTVEFELSGNFLVAPQFAPEAPADLPARLPQSGDIESANFWVRLSGGWAVRGPGTVCAAATIRQFAWQSDGFADSVREDGGTTPDTATLCLTDMGSLEFTSVSVQLRRIAVPTTPTFTGLLSPDPEMVFSLNMSGYLSTRVFVDQTLDLSPAVGTHDGNLFLDQYLYLSAPDPVDWTFWYYGGYQAANNGVTPLGQVTVTPIP